MSIPDPLFHAEQVLKKAHSSTQLQLRPVYRRYPTTFLLLITFSVAAVFHGLDAFLDEFSLFTASPLTLVGIGMVGLFATGALYKRLGRDKYEK